MLGSEAFKCLILLVLSWFDILVSKIEYVPADPQQICESLTGFLVYPNWESIDSTKPPNCCQCCIVHGS